MGNKIEIKGWGLQKKFSAPKGFDRNEGEEKKRAKKRVRARG